MSLRLKLTAALGVALVILLVGVASLYALRQSSNAAAAVEHSERVRVELERALTTVVNAETGQRGYLITQDSSYLEPYTSARTNLDHQLATIRTLIEDNPSQLARVDSLGHLADAKLVEMNETVVLTQAGMRDSALRLVMTGRGAELTRLTRATVDSMEATQSEQLTERVNIYNSRKLAVTLVIVIGTLLAATIAVITMLWLRSGIRQLEAARDTIKVQSVELGDEQTRSRSLTDMLAASDEGLLQANTVAASATGRLEQLLQSTDEAIFGMDADGLCTFINVSGARMLGYDRTELLGKDMHEALHHHHADGTPYPLENCPIHKAMIEGTSVRIADEVFWTSAGKPVPVEYSSSPILSNGKTVGAVVAFSDITARRIAERERERLIGALARSNQELDQFAYVASHDLKAPLRGIANLSQWIEEDLGDDLPPDVSEKMGLVRGRVQRLEALIDGILQYSRAGRVRAAVEQVDVGLLVRDVVELLAPPAEIAVTIERGFPTITTERTPLQQVFMNLISNAIKYNRRPGATVTVSWRDAGRMYAFSVSDNGPGIEPEYHDRIFGIFQTLESRDRVEGTGIGLSVVKKTVELHGGSVTVRSALGEGATFTFEWPKSAEETAAA